MVAYLTLFSVEKCNLPCLFPLSLNIINDVFFVIISVECAIQGAEMNGIHQNGKDRSFEKTFPGCLGRMVNLFDLNGAVAGNRLLTDKSHQDGAYSFLFSCTTCLYFPGGKLGHL